MSLINDALRRAKQAQQEKPAETPDPHFRPVDPPSQGTRRNVGLLLPVLLTAVALLGLLLSWELSRKNASTADSNGQITAAARTPSTSDSPGSGPGAPAPVPGTAVISNSPVGSKSAQNIPDGRADAPVAPATNTVATGSDPSDTNRANAAETAAPPVAPLKLQGITYNPRRPSAMINGRVIFLGDRVREYRVIAIHRDDVVLADAGRTNVLSLEP